MESRRRTVTRLLCGFLAGSATVPAVRATSQIYTSSVSYCAAPEAIFVDTFGLQYVDKSSLISFAIRAQSVQQNLYATLNLSLQAYDLSVVNLNVDLCSVLDGFLCPLPTYRFDGATSLAIPSTFTSKIPGIAYIVPDLEAVATLRLTSIDTGAEEACIQAALSNGKTTYLTAVQWGVAAIALIAFASTILHTLWPQLLSEAHKRHSTPEWRLVLLLSYYQHIAFSGMLSVTAPKVFRSYTLNYAWSTFLIRIGPITRSLDRLRGRTGGDTTDNSSALDAIAALTRRSAMPAAPEQFANMTRQAGLTSSSSLVSYASKVTKPSFAYTNYATTNVPVIGGVGSPNITIGISTYSELLGIPFGNVFMTAFINVLLLLCIMIVLLALVYAIFALYLRRQLRRQTRNQLWIDELKRRRHYFMATNSFRILLIAYPPIVTFAFYGYIVESTTGWASALLGTLSWVSMTFIILLVSIKLLKAAKRHEDGIDHLYDSEKFTYRTSSLFTQFKPDAFYYFIPIILVTFIEACFISFAQGYPTRQVVGLIVVESLLFIATVWHRPYATKGANVLAAFLQFSRVVTYALQIAFLDSTNVKAIPKVVIGIVIIVIQSIFVLILFLSIMIGLIAAMYRGIRGRGNYRRNSDLTDKDAAATEKGINTGESAFVASSLNSSVTNVGALDNPKPPYSDRSRFSSPAQSLPEVPPERSDTPTSAEALFSPDTTARATHST
ncbi:uncharacterized protein L969DRAFT_48524 [Mixia osmundae IAM 14324]|uniref:ML-like domain-containing protein n=1 Tax=Mixia osmundae (strain CBS 9802 / IAM 14324 / JCM 22182 / KY 12970) TaxID=764103 RepID=G7E3C3_MIXOS|nr:uncharacterized protein L969DRAFT_48524 [Mixia osmundae IAM 14324]KEI39319.1 hypothetical protein L969DRAFT_48524 [Mixia osmundae IAM 14324]GAA97333.1 hypothetical protein E5Q_04011 [Mixia osmundae IAM 14324]